MRQGSPSNVRTIVSPTGSQPGSKSLFQNILDVSPYPSRFYPYPSFPALHKLLRMSILEEQRKEVGSRHSPKFECKSLLQKILPISPYPSIFWRDLALVLTKQVLKNEYFRNPKRKNVEDRPHQ